MERAKRNVMRAWCLFRSDGSPFAVGLEAVTEVVEADRTVRLPLSPPRVLGLCAVRRDVVPVVRLSGHGEERPDESVRRINVLILRTAHGSWGVRVDQEGTVVAEAALDDSDAGPDARPAAILGSIRREGTTYTVVDPELAWRDVRTDIEAHYTSFTRSLDPTFDLPEDARDIPMGEQHPRGRS
jgi:purine-binding chemotaxis protein CheW